MHFTKIATDIVAILSFLYFVILLYDRQYCYY